jgi:endonuclease/exonuclease/phosphatase family metal-dependent hydrolase
VRIVTWNLWWRFGPWADRQKAILAVLRELRPDVVGLQEVWEADGENLAGWLAAELGLHWTWAASEAPGRWQRRLQDSAAGRVGVGNAVLSRWPVAERAVLRLPAPEHLDDGRLALYAGLDAPGGRIPFFTVHLTSASDACEVRAGQVTALTGFIAEHARGSGHPPVLTGDFNAEPDAAEVRPLAAHGLRDVWEYAAPAAPSATRDPANPYRTGVQAARVDHIRVGPPGPGTVRAVRRAGDGPVDGVWPSDHAAVVADLNGGPGTPGW